MNLLQYRTKPSEIISNSPLSTENKQTLLLWHDFLAGQNITEHRLYKLMYQSSRVFNCIDKNISTLSLNDLSQILVCINKEPNLSDGTKADYRRCVKQFFNWYKHFDEEHDEKFYHFMQKTIKRGIQRKQINITDIISEEDLEIIINKGCRSSLERAFLSLLHETGMRAGEILNIKLKDIEWKDECVIITVDGKTGMRRVPIVKSVHHLKFYLNNREYNNPEDIIWDSPNLLVTKRRQMDYTNASTLVKRAMWRAEVDKPCNLHWYRHSRASINAKFMTEPILCRFMGWVIGSDQVRTYVHLCDDSVVESVKNIYSREWMSNQQGKLGFTSK